MNVKLLKQIAEVIIEKPRQFNMHYWHRNEKVRAKNIDFGVDKDYEALCDLPAEKQISCDTTHCIAGWAQALSPNRKCKSPAEKDARRLLEITPSMAKRLFFCNLWPDQFRGKRGDLWKPTRQQAVGRINHFIATEGRE